MSKLVGTFIVLFLVCVSWTFGFFIGRAETIKLVATSDVPISSDMEGRKVIRVLKKGEALEVIYCDDTKKTAIPVVQIDGASGYPRSEDFRLERQHSIYGTSSCP